MIHHYITKYWDGRDGAHYAESWLQLNLFGRCWCFWRRRIPTGREGSPEGEPED